MPRALGEVRELEKLLGDYGPLEALDILVVVRFWGFLHYQQDDQQFPTYDLAPGKQQLPRPIQY